jgi:hypothetical protein
MVGNGKNLGIRINVSVQISISKDTLRTQFLEGIYQTK